MSKWMLNKFLTVAEGGTPVDFKDHWGEFPAVRIKVRKNIDPTQFVAIGRGFELTKSSDGFEELLLVNPSEETREELRLALAIGEILSMQEEKVPLKHAHLYARERHPQAVISGIAVNCKIMDTMNEIVLGLVDAGVMGAPCIENGFVKAPLSQAGAAIISHEAQSQGLNIEIKRGKAPDDPKPISMHIANSPKRGPFIKSKVLSSECRVEQEDDGPFPPLLPVQQPCEHAQLTDEALTRIRGKR